MSVGLKTTVILAVLAGLLVLAACSPAPTPEIITHIETVIVEREAEPVTIVETVEVPVTVEVEKIVEVEVTPTPFGRLYQGVEATLVTAADAPVVELLQQQAQAFQALTGAAITIETVPDLNQSVLIDEETGQNRYAGYIYPAQWLADYAAQDYLADLTDRIQADQTLEWDDIAPIYRDVAAGYGERTYGIPIAGDVQLVYYRPDVLEEIGLPPPKTWDDYVEIAGAANELDINADSSPDFGSCLARAEQSYTIFYSMVSPYLQFEGFAQGGFFSPDNFAPLVDNQGFRRALELYKETILYSPPEELRNGLAETRQLMLDGRCTLTVDSTTLGHLAADPDQSAIADKIAVVALPGAADVVNRPTGTLAPCDEDQDNCPFAADEINHAPFMPSGGWVGSLNPAAADPTQKAVYDFLVYVSAPDQANPAVAADPALIPYRISQYLNRQPWVEAGFSPDFSANFLSAIEQTLASPNAVLNLRIPSHQRYQAESLSPLLDQYLSDQLTTDQVVAALLDEWQTVTDAAGRQEQLEAYLLSLGLTSQ
ncbi:MAG: extracellular solute-binding protein [Anaerolineae bacterium]|nr:extracellular solute-binding protein [Anaerolineae bacterium]